MFRLGDFYECFNNDAKIISKILGIVLTTRGKGENKRPMAGIPHHSLENYLPKLIKAGYKAAIVEQLEEPKKGKKIVDRGVVRVVTSGTITNDKILNEGKNNYLAAITTNKINKNKVICGIAVSDLTTGEFYLSEFSSEPNLERAVAEINRICPAELLVDEEDITIWKEKAPNISIQKIPSYNFNFKDRKETLLDHFNVENLKGFGVEDYKVAITSAGIVLDYLKDTQKSSLKHITKIYYKRSSDYMFLDTNTVKSLELIEPRQNEGVSLIEVINDCKCPMGKRKIHNWVLSPLLNSKQIKSRLESVYELKKDTIALKSIREKIDNIYDIERILGKIGTENVNAKDLIALKVSLVKIETLKEELANYSMSMLKTIYKSVNHNQNIQEVIDLISNSINEDPPNTITEGGIIQKGYDKKLDSLKEAAKEGKDWIKNLQKKEKKRTGISSLKVKYNKVIGYFIQVSKPNLDKVPENYIRKQTLVNSERFITEELKEKEEFILNSEEKLFELEYKIFLEIRDGLNKYLKHIQELSDKIAVLDVLSNFAYIARKQNYSMPEIVDGGNDLLEITEGRHPVVEQIEEQFISNSTNLDSISNQISIITGPNMAGKSTYIRQVALIVLMAQIGSFVPAEKMKFSPVDRIFTRIGASDNLAGGESTFLVEMNETANILNNATRKSLIILDEVGRGTSTYDGVAIAWATTFFIHERIKAKTLFATHYHELVDLRNYLDRVINRNVAIDENKGKIIFLRKLKKGGTDKSYGVHVAQLAGIPGQVIRKAKEILMSLEQEGIFEVKHVETELSKKQDSKQQLPLTTKLPENPLVNELRDLNVDNITPMQALEKLQAYKKRLNKEDN